MIPNFYLWPLSLIWTLGSHVQKPTWNIIELLFWFKKDLLISHYALGTLLDIENKRFIHPWLNKVELDSSPMKLILQFVLIQ